MNERGRDAFAAKLLMLYMRGDVARGLFALRHPLLDDKKDCTPGSARKHSPDIRADARHRQS